MLSLYLLQFVYVIQFPVSQVFSSNFKGMVFYLLGLYWDWDKLFFFYGSRWVQGQLQLPAFWVFNSLEYS